jgi:hypothetical protein
MKHLLLNWLLIGVFILVAATAQAQDVYNFYFQKSPTATVTPGATSAPLTPTTGEAAPSGAPATPNNSTTAPAPKEDSTNTFKTHWQVMVGTSQDSANDHPGISLLAGYDLNRYFGIELGEQYYFGAMGLPAHLEGLLGVSVTPIHINIFGRETFEIGAVAGVMSASNSQYGRVAQFGGPYLGARVGLRFSDMVSLVTTARATFGDRTDGATASAVDLGLRFRF